MNGGFQQSSGQGIDPELQRYIKEALDNGVSREEIEKALIEADWPQDKINEAFFILSSQQQTGFEGTQFSQQGIQQGMQQGSQGFQGSQFPAAQQSPYQSYPWVGQQQGYYPQQVTVSAYAGFWIRVLAYFIDGLIMLAGSFVLFFFIGFFGGAILALKGGNIKESSIFYLILALIGLVSAWLYSAFMESSGNQGTLGKMVCRIKVVDLNGQRISFGKATARFFAKFSVSLIYSFIEILLPNLARTGLWNIVMFLVLVIFFGWIAFDKRKQGLYDKMVGTLVVKK
jgi:uncharacterized RDD family membrane protein YckC